MASVQKKLINSSMFFFYASCVIANAIFIWPTSMIEKVCLQPTQPSVRSYVGGVPCTNINFIYCVSTPTTEENLSHKLQLSVFLRDVI